MNMMSTSLIVDSLSGESEMSKPEAMYSALMLAYHAKGIVDGKQARLFGVLAHRCDTLIPHVGAPMGHRCTE
jgi:hypothetical protein